MFFLPASAARSLIAYPQGVLFQLCLGDSHHVRVSVTHALPPPGRCEAFRVTVRYSPLA